MGLIDTVKGQISFYDEDLCRFPAHRRVHLGIGYLPEDRWLIHRLTVEEIILLPSWAVNMSDVAAGLSRIYEMMPEVARLDREVEAAGKLRNTP
jgi:ABC-type branched-subunit amino acid transport system ATPase component